jgi:hypothetical protein
MFGHLTIKEISLAEIYWIYQSQQYSFTAKIAPVKSHESLPHGMFLKFYPFLTQQVLYELVEGNNILN